MQSEAAVSPQHRYLLVDFFFSDSAVGQLKKDVASRNTNKLWPTEHNLFMNWQRQENQLAVYSLYAYADLTLPKPFDIIFQVDQPGNYTQVHYQVTQSFYEGWIPMPMVEDGHKHILVLTFQEKLPAILALLPNELNRGKERAIRLGLCSSDDFSAIAERRAKVLSLSAQYGADWWKHDPESN